MAITYQSSQLIAFALGISSDPVLNAGVHLRWAFAPARGFPNNGFTIYRRAADMPQGEIVDLSAPGTTVTLTAGGTQATSGWVAITSSLPMTFVAGTGLVIPAGAQVTVNPGVMCVKITPEISHVGSGNTSLTGQVAMGGSTLSLAPSTTAATARTAVAYQANRLDTLRIAPGAASGGCKLHSVRRVSFTSARDVSAWPAAIATRVLTTSPAALAARRASRALTIAQLGAYDARLGDLGALISGYIAAGYGRPPASTFTSGDRRITVGRMEYLWLAGYDPTVAEEIGLYYFDPVGAGSYDYKIVGEYSSGADQQAWVLFGVSPSATLPVAAPPAPAVRRTGTSPGTGPAGNDVWLEWAPAPQKNLIKPALMPPWQYQVVRRPAGAPASSDVIATTVVAAPDHASIAPQAVDRGLAAGSYEYRLRSVDPFGRVSALGAPVTVSLSTDRAPPPPGPVSASIQGSTLTVRWLWTALQAAQAPDIDRFRVKVHDQSLAPLSGAVTAVSTVSAGTYQVTLDVGVDEPGASYSGGRMSAAGTDGAVHYYAIDSILADSPLSLRVIADGGSQVAPAPGAAATLTLDVDWSNQARWSTALAPTVAYSAPVPIPASWTWDPAGPATSFAAQALAITASQGTAPRYYEATYTLDPALVASADGPVKHLLVGVGAIDTADHKGQMSAPVLVASRWDTAPSPPSSSWGADVRWAGYPDARGEAGYALEFAAASTSVGYEVYRAADEALFAWNRARATPRPLPAGAASDHERPDDDLLALAGEAGSAEVFQRVTTGPRFAASAGEMLIVQDRFRARVAGSTSAAYQRRVVYRVISVDLAGNRAALDDCAPGPVVHLRATVPPRRVRWTGAAAEPGGVALTFTRHADESPAQWVLYRALSASALDDIWSRTPHATLALADLDASRPGRLTYREATDPGQSHAYVVVAEDASGNRSPASAIITARAAHDTTPPAAPSFLPASGSATAGWSLSWTIDARTTEVTVQRSTPARPRWTTALAWSAATAMADAPLASDTAVTYRIRARNAVGSQSGWSVLRLPAASAAPEAPRPTLAAWNAAGTLVELAWALGRAGDQVGVTRADRTAGTTTDLGWQAAGATGMTDSGASPASALVYTLRLRDAAGTEASRTASASVTPISAAMAATSLSASHDGQTASLSWHMSSIAALEPCVELQAADGSYSELSGWLPAGTTSWSEAVTGNRTYRVKTRTRPGVMAASSSVTAYDPAVAPEPPAWDDPVDGWNEAWTAISLSWAVTRADLEVRVQRSLDGASFSAASAWLAAGTSAWEDDDASLDPTITTYYRLHVRTSAGVTSSAASAPVLSVEGTSAVPDAPAITSADWNALRTKVVVRWAPVRSGVEVKVQRAPVSTGVYADVSGWIASTTTECDDTGAPATTEALYRTVARNAAGTEGTPSDAVYLAAIDAVPDPAEWVAAAWDATGTSVTLRWMDRSGREELSYSVERSADGGASWTTAVTSAGVTVAEDGSYAGTDTGAPSGVALSYRAIATTPGGVTTASPAVATAPAAGTAPSAPAWETAAWNLSGAVPGVELIWTWPEYGLSWKIQRKTGASAWTDLHAFQTDGFRRFIDTTAASGVQHKYRLSVMNAAGLTNTSYNVATVEPG